MPEINNENYMIPHDKKNPTLRTKMIVLDAPPLKLKYIKDWLQVLYFTDIFIGKIPVLKVHLVLAVLLGWLF